MKSVCILILILSLFPRLEAQVVNRYPNIQRPSQTSATIAWRRANPSTGTLYLGLSSGVWFDSVSTTGLEQKHFFDLTGLDANTEYFYQVISIAPADTFISSIESFFTAPLATSDKISFLAYGDCGYNNSTQNQVKSWMEMQTVDFALVTGDIDQGIGDAYDNVFFGVYKNMLKQDCHFTCIGNHDTYADNAATYLDAFYLFSNNPANSERYYSYEWGDAKFICLDANIDYTSGSAQFNWMVDEFKCHDKKWLFVFFHQPPWTNAWSLDYYLPFSPYFLYEGDEDMRTDLVPEFEKYKVDFVINGHSHCYQRGEMNGVQYLITGGAGSSTMDANTNNSSPNLSVEIYENHYIRFDINGDTAKYVMINSNGIHRDSVSVIKQYLHYSQNISGTDLTCNGASDGSILLNVSGQKLPYTFLWNNGYTTPNLSGLDGGTYTVLITDAVGCERTDTITINEPPEVNTQILSSTGNYVLCDSNSIILSATGNNINYSWSTGDTTSSILVSSAGTYSITAFDSSGCTSPIVSTTVTTDSTPYAISFQYTSNGLIANFITNNQSGFYNWNFGDGTTSTLQNPIHIYNSANLYTVELIIINGCGSDTTIQVIDISNTSVGHIDTIKQFNIKTEPNPFSDFTLLSFENPYKDDLSLTITDLYGKKLRHYYNCNNGQLRIDKNELIAGFYLYTLIGENLIATGKLIVK
ncbi:metallophosphoesterase [Aureispira]|nr:metallophosphoesterase [Aureispira sp.]